MKNYIFEIFFFIGLMLLPMAIIDGSLVSYADIKICLLMAITANCALHLFIKKESLRISPYIILIGCYLLIKILTFGPVYNLGLKFQSLALTLSFFVVSLWVYNHNLSPKLFSLALVPSVILAVTSSLSMSLYRIPLLSSYSPFGAPIGLKNSLSIFLAQVIPIFLLSLFYLRQKKEMLALMLKGTFTLLITMSTWVIFMNRTRSAWWMILSIFISLSYLSLKKNREIKTLTLYLGFCIIIALLFNSFIPNKLKWRSQTPYLDSLQTMISFEKSNGRNQLWKVGFEIIKQNPALGIGTGNYSILWQNFIHNSEVSPKTFKFLRQDLPIFNDYLQAVIENGMLGGFIFFIVSLVYTTYFILKTKLKTPEFLLLLTCMITVLDAFFDYPFNRSENLLIFAITSTLSLKSLEKPSYIKNIKTTRFIKILLLGIILFSTTISIRLAFTTYHRREYHHNREIYNLKKAWETWPWDIQWNSSKIDILLSVGEGKFAQDITKNRVKFWPNDPESFLMQAIIAENNSSITEANNLYIKALSIIDQGLCYYPAFERYKNFSKKHSLAPTVDMKIKLLNCSNN